MADQGRGDLMGRRDYRSGSVFQKCEPKRSGCPELVDGVRPPHKCKGRWMGVAESGFTANGARKRVTVTGKTEGEAKRRLRGKQLELEIQGRNRVVRTVTVAKWAETWLERIETKVTPSALQTDRAAVKAILPVIGHVKLADLTPDDVLAVAVSLRRAGKSTSTALRYHGSLMRMLKAASLNGHNIAPHVLLADAPDAAVNDRQAVSFDHAIKALQHVATMPDGSRWALAFLQGLRQAEALGLTWDAVDLERGTLTIAWQVKSLRYRDRKDPSKGFVMPDGYEARHIVGSTHLVRPKSKAGWRVQPLVPWAVNALATWREVAPDHALVWPGRTTRAGTWPRNPASDRKQWEAIQAAVDIAHPSGRPYAVHEIRHATATLLLELQVEESVRVAIMGHSTIASTRTYEFVNLDEARKALERAAGRLRLGGFA